MRQLKRELEVATTDAARANGLSEEQQRELAQQLEVVHSGWVEEHHAFHRAVLDAQGTFDERGAFGLLHRLYQRC